MTTAEMFARRFERAGRNERGFTPWDHLNSLRSQMRREAVDFYRDPAGNGSYDQSLVFEFADGSSVILHNPDQAAFAAYLTVKSAAEK